MSATGHAAPNRGCAPGVAPSNRQRFLSYDHSPTVGRTRIFFFFFFFILDWIQELAKLPSCAVLKPTASLYTNNNKPSTTAARTAMAFLAQTETGPLSRQLCSQMTPRDLSLPKTAENVIKR